jgi:hypothetical protein
VAALVEAARRAMAGSASACSTTLNCWRVPWAGRREQVGGGALGDPYGVVQFAQTVEQRADVGGGLLSRAAHC